MKPIYCPRAEDQHVEYIAIKQGICDSVSYILSITLRIRLVVGMSVFRVSVLRSFDDDDAAAASCDGRRECGALYHYIT